MNEPLDPEAIIASAIRDGMADVASIPGYRAADAVTAGILAALERAGYVVTLAERPDYWPHRGAVNGLHLPDPGGINVGRDGRPIR